MKDYYNILGITEKASQAQIKAAFRKLAFKYHPDRNPDKEKWAEDRFKEINEAYCVLGDGAKRRQYDSARRSPLAGAAYSSPGAGFQYSQQDIFNRGFSDQSLYEDLNRMFGQAGLRFDRDFIKRVFFQNGIWVYHTSDNSSSTGTGNFTGNPFSQQAYSSYKPSIVERWLYRAIGALNKFVFGSLMGTGRESSQLKDLDQNIELVLSGREARDGGEIPIHIKRGGQAKKLMVKIPGGIKNGIRIRLKGMGEVEGSRSGDLYLQVKVRD